MMGSRGCVGGYEFEHLTRARRFGKWRPGLVKFSKRKFWKRKRKAARREAWREAAQVADQQAN